MATAASESASSAVQTKAAQMALGRCPVCGCDLGSDFWRCSLCQTPHHSDCVRYFGGCAIYGCRDGHPATRMERAFWPWSLSLMTWFRRVRCLEAPVLATCLVGPPVVATSFCASSLGRDVCQFLWNSGMMLLVGCGLLYFTLEIIASMLLAALEYSVECHNDSRVSLSGSRLNEVLPRLKSRGSVSAVLSWIGTALGPVSVLLVLVDATGYGFVTGYVTLMMLAGSRQLELHLQEVDVTTNRLRASFMPMPSKNDIKF